MFHKVAVEYVATAESIGQMLVDDSYRVTSTATSSMHLDVKLKPMNFKHMRTNFTR